MKSAPTIVYVIAGICALASNCHGMLIFRLDGYISELSSADPHPTFSVGQSWEMEVIYDEDAEDSTEWSPGIDADPSDGRYGSAIISLRFESGDYILDASQGGIYISDDQTFTDVMDPFDVTDDFEFVGDSMAFRPIPTGVNNFSPELGGNLSSLSINFLDRDAEVFDSDALPVSTPSLDLFESSGGRLYWTGASDLEYISIQVSSLTIVPEPKMYVPVVGMVSLFAVLIARPRNSRSTIQTK